MLSRRVRFTNWFTEPRYGIEAQSFSLPSRGGPLEEGLCHAAEAGNEAVLVSQGEDAEDGAVGGDDQP